MALPKAIAPGAYIGVNLLFLLKYGGRVGTEWAIALCVVYLALLHIVYHKWIKSDSNLPRWVLIGCITACLMLIGVQLAINPYSIQVDRWSAIHNFLSYLLQGKYPYAAHTHLGGYGSPFPVWQLLHLPFYALGNVGLSLFACIGLYIHSLYNWKGKHITERAGVLLLLSPAVWYESAVRSDLLANFLLVSALIQYLIYYKVELCRHFVAIAIGCALLLSTRLSVGIPLFIFFVGEYLRFNWQKKVGFPLLVLVVFGLTFLPFLLWSSDLFLFEFNPFVLQTRQGTTLDILLVIAMLIVAAWAVERSKESYFLVTGTVLIAMVALVFVHNMTVRGDFTELFSSVYDITYFDMSLPFIITAILMPYKPCTVNRA